jgi:hypothetical protein
LIALALAPVAVGAQSLCLQTGVALDGEAFQINSPGTSVAGPARAAWNPDREEYFVVWSAFDTGSWRLHGQRLSVDGVPVGTSQEIIADSNAIIDPAIVAAAGHDEYLIAWQTQSDPFNGARGIVLAGNGDTIADNFVISVNGAEPALAYAAATQTFMYSGRGSGISAQRIDLSGTLSGHPLSLATTDDGAPGPNGEVSANAEGQVLALWRNQVDERLDGRRISAAGALAGGIVPYAPDYPGSGRAAFIDYKADSDDYVALYSFFQGEQVKWITVDSAGNGSAAQSVATGSDLAAIATAYDAIDANTLLLWSRSDPDTGINALSAQLLSPAGTLIGTPTPLLTLPAYGFTLAPARERGEALLTWPGNVALNGQLVKYGCILRDEIFADGFE